MNEITEAFFRLPVEAQVVLVVMLGVIVLLLVTRRNVLSFPDEVTLNLEMPDNFDIRCKGLPEWPEQLNVKLDLPESVRHFMHDDDYNAGNAGDADDAEQRDPGPDDMHKMIAMLTVHENHLKALVANDDSDVDSFNNAVRDLRNQCTQYLKIFD